MALQKIGEKALQVSSSLQQIPAKQKPKKEVLDEDQYVEDLEKIIVRDFYPDLPKLKVQKEYLTALQTNDREKLREIHLKYGAKRTVTSGKTPDIYSTPSTFETPIDRPKDTPVPTTSAQAAESAEPPVQEGDEPIDKVQEGPTHNPEPKEEKKASDVSLDKYLSKHTSEDNASFVEIMEEADRKHRIKNAWLFEQQQEKSDDLESQLALPGIEQQAIESGNSTRLQTWTYTPKNAVMYVPEGVEHSSKEMIQAKGKQAQEITHTNTRFTVAPFNKRKNDESIAEAVSSQAVLLHGRVGVDGKEMLPSTTPKVNGYGFVGTPSPAPGVEDSPLMTWGEIEGTPFRLDGGDTPVRSNATPGPLFKIPQVPNRDRIGLQLAEKASKSHRDKKQQAMQRVRSNFASPSPKFGASKTDRLGYLSPAAQRLASNKLGIRTNTDKALRASYTPSPTHRLRGEKTPLSSLKTPTPGASSSRRSQRGTPKSGSSTPVSASPADKRSATVSLTDNLLNLPKRQKAHEFF